MVINIHLLVLFLNVEACLTGQGGNVMDDMIVSALSVIADAAAEQMVAILVDDSLLALSVCTGALEGTGGFVEWEVEAMFHDFNKD